MIKHPHGSLKIILVNFFWKAISNFIFFIFLFFFPNIKKNENSILISRATYTPWIVDKFFINLYKKIKDLTLLDEARLYTLYNHANQLKNTDACILDLGCMKGGAGILLSMTNKKGKTFLFDTFNGFLDNENGLHRKDIFIYKKIGEVRKKIDDLNLKKTYVYKKYFPKNLGNLPIKKIKICHIDVNTYQSTKSCYNFVRNKIVKNGVIIFDDYGILGVEKVTDFVNEISKKDKNFFVFFYNYFGQAILLRK